MPITPEGRRPLTSRDSPIFIKLAAALARAGVSPNAISATSIVFGVAAGFAFAATSVTEGFAARGCWLAAAAFIQLRLIANLLDGMVAVEGRRGGPTGNLWNEVPDRIADAAIFIGAGFAAGSSPTLGYLAALFAVFVAYLRALGASVGAGQLFHGPMAKPHRMFTLTVLAVVSALVPESWHHVSKSVSPGNMAFTFGPAALALLIVILGCVITSYRRLHRIATFLRSTAA